MASPEPLRLTVIGCGYLGITTAASFASLGFEVLGHAESPIEGPAGNREWLLGLRLP